MSTNSVLSIRLIFYFILVFPESCYVLVLGLCFTPELCSGVYFVLILFLMRTVL